MWIKNLPPDYINMPSHCYHDVFLWQSDKVFVMDNHKSALWCWLQACNPQKSYNFMHIDRHYDMQDSFFDEDLLPVKENSHLSFEDYSELKRKDGKFQVFRWDNYIIAGRELHKRWFHTNICISHKQGSWHPGWGHKPLSIREEEPIDMSWCIQQYIYKPEKDFDGFDGNDYKLPWIVNLDLDVFFTGDSKIQLFSDEYIRYIAELLQKSMKRIAVLTIAISPECLGGNDLQEQWGNGFRVLRIMSEKLECLESFFKSVNDCD